MVYRIFVADPLTDFNAELLRTFPPECDLGVPPDGRYYDFRTRGGYDVHVIGGLRPLEAYRLERSDGIEREATAEDLETAYHLAERLLVDVEPGGETINWRRVDGNRALDAIGALLDRDPASAPRLSRELSLVPTDADAWRAVRFLVREYPDLSPRERLGDWIAIEIEAGR